MINYIDIDYEWLIKEIMNKNPHNNIEMIKYIRDILKLDATIKNSIIIEKIVEVVCNLNEELRNMPKIVPPSVKFIELDYTLLKAVHDFKVVYN